MNKNWKKSKVFEFSYFHKSIENVELFVRNNGNNTNIYLSYNSGFISSIVNTEKDFNVFHWADQELKDYFHKLTIQAQATYAEAARCNDYI